MRLEKVNAILLLLGLPLMFFNSAIGLGWIIGQLVMIALVISRRRFYTNMMDSTVFNMKQYVSYVLFTILLITIPLLISFAFNEIINPLAIFMAYFVGRILTFVFNLFVKEDVSNAN